MLEISNNAMKYECYSEDFQKAVKKAFKEKASEYLKSLPDFKSSYQTWYSESKILIKQLLPDRVVLEKHLENLCLVHNIKISKKNPTISDYNEQLKSSSVLDIPSWRHIQLLGDIRNLCDHNKNVEPTAEQVKDLIDGVEKVIKTIF